MARRLLLPVALLTATFACKLGPDYARPPLVTPEKWREMEAAGPMVTPDESVWFQSGTAALNGCAGNLRTIAFAQLDSETFRKISRAHAARIECMNDLQHALDAFKRGAETLRDLRNRLAQIAGFIDAVDQRMPEDAVRRVGHGERELLFQMIREASPEAEVYCWSDMLDPNHNAHGDYYLVEGDFTGSWQHVHPHAIGWHVRERMI